MAERCVQLADAARHTLVHAALADYPAECCGVLLGYFQDGRVDVHHAVPIRNAVTEGRGYRFELETSALLVASRQARAAGMDIVGFYHSHPDDVAQPSQSDLHESNPWPGYCYLIASVMRAQLQALTAWQRVGDTWVENTLEEN